MSALHVPDLYDRIGDAGRRRVRRAWPGVAFLLLLAVALPKMSGEQVSRIPAPLFALLFLGVMVSGWLLAVVGGQLPGIRRAPARLRSVAFAVVAGVIAAAVWLAVRQLFADTGLAAKASGGVAGAFVAGGVAARLFGRRAAGTQLVMALTIATWGFWDLTALPFLPFRDVRIYLDAGAAWVAGQPVYLRQAMTSVSPDMTGLPFVYPPFLLPFFGALSWLPQGVAIGLWEVVLTAASVAALHLLGVRRGWIPLLLLWPPISIGLSVGNVAAFGLLGLAAGWRWGPALLLGGMFKAQAAVPALWHVRERRWRQIMIGFGVLLALVLVTLPFTGIAIYGDWLTGLSAFEELVQRFPLLAGGALQHEVPGAVALAVAVGAIVIAALAAGRNGLARFGIASIAASPTLYVHGIALLLPAALMLDATSCWLVLGLSFLGPGFGTLTSLLFAALVLGLTRAEFARREPAGDGREQASGGGALHPLGVNLEPWPGDRG